MPIKVRAQKTKKEVARAGLPARFESLKMDRKLWQFICRTLDIGSIELAQSLGYRTSSVDRSGLPNNAWGKKRMHPATAIALGYYCRDHGTSLERIIAQCEDSISEVEMAGTLGLTVQQVRGIVDAARVRWIFRPPFGFIHRVDLLRLLDPNAKALCDLLRRHPIYLWRVRKGVGLRAARALLGFDDRTISAWENGTSLPNFAAFARLRERFSEEFCRKCCDWYEEFQLQAYGIKIKAHWFDPVSLHLST